MNFLNNNLDRVSYILLVILTMYIFFSSNQRNDGLLYELLILQQENLIQQEQINQLQEVIGREITCDDVPGTHIYTDANNDGLTDVVSCPTESEGFQIELINTGTGWARPTSTDTPSAVSQ